jgi:hypothetical protein
MLQEFRYTSAPGRVIVDPASDNVSATATAARKMAPVLGRLRDLCVSGNFNMIIDYATALRREGSGDGGHREHGAVAAGSAMNAQQQMRWFPRSAHLVLKVMLKVWTVVNGTFDQDDARRAELSPPLVWTVARPHKFWTVSVDDCQNMGPSTRSAVRDIVDAVSSKRHCTDKAIIGRHLRAWTLPNRQTEAKIGCNLLNRMTEECVCQSGHQESS